jgi:lipoate synthase
MQKDTIYTVSQYKIYNSKRVATQIRKSLKTYPVCKNVSVYTNKSNIVVITGEQLDLVKKIVADVISKLQQMHSIKLQFGKVYYKVN